MERTWSENEASTRAPPRRTVPRPRGAVDGNRNIGVVVAALISVLCTVRGWQWMDPGQRQAQLAMSAAATAIAVLALAAPRFFMRHRALTVTASRSLIILMPATKELIAGLLGTPSGSAMSVLGMRWAYRNPLGSLGIILFASRLPIIGIAPLYTPMSLGASFLSQVALAAAAGSTDYVMCTSPLAHGPEVLPWLKAVHWSLSGAWDLVSPAPWNPLPPLDGAAPGVSLLAVTLLVRLACVVFPLAANAAREARVYRELLLAVARGGAAAAAARGRPLPKRAPAAARITLFFRWMGRYPVHAAFFGLACVELVWCGVFAAAQRVCGSA